MRARDRTENVAAVLLSFRVEDLFQVAALAGLLRCREVLRTERHAAFVAGDGATFWAVMDAGRDVRHDRIAMTVEDRPIVLVEFGNSIDDHVLARHGGLPGLSIEPTPGVGEPEPVGVPLGLVTAEDVELWTTGLGPTTTVLVVEERDDLGPLVKTVGDGPRNRLLDLAGPLGDEVVGAEHNAPELAAEPPLIP